MFHEVWQLEKFQSAKVTFKIIQEIKGIGTGLVPFDRHYVSVLQMLCDSEHIPLRGDLSCVH